VTHSPGDETASLTSTLTWLTVSNGGVLYIISTVAVPLFVLSHMLI